ncbi:MAG: protein kinase [Planctomycetes bacterium]|nr:protein kinase [Planctomycetota bacterium]
MGWLRLHPSEGEELAPEIQYREVTEDGLVFGRSARVTWSIDDGTVSRRHARFFRDGNTDYVEDLGSTNGTSVNGRRIAGARPLADGDQIGVGDRRFTYELLAPVHLAETPVPTGASTYTIEAESSRSPAPATPPGPVVTDAAPVLTDTTRWTSVELVGRGGMGEVYRAIDHDLGCAVAIKRLRRRDDGSDRILERLHVREAAIARTIQHPNVVTVLEDGVHEGDPYMLLEWIEGPTFDRYLTIGAATGGAPSMGEKVECLRQVALGLAAAHRAGVVHADLKPANILVSPSEDLSKVDNLSILESPDHPAGIADEVAVDPDLEEEIARRLGLPEVPDFDSIAFVGREGELALLEAFADELVQPRAGAAAPGFLWVIVFGERGSGKARLCDELRLSLAARQRSVELRVTDDGTLPPSDFRGLWVSLVPPLLPDLPELLERYELERAAGRVRELYLKPFLIGQSIRFVERIVQHARSARAFVECVDIETRGNPARLVERLRGSFESGAWALSGHGYRFRPDALGMDDIAIAKRLLTRLESEEKGLRDLLVAIAPIGGNLDFTTMVAASGMPSAGLSYLVEYAVREGYLRRDRRGDCSIVVEPLRAALDARVDPKTRAKIAKRALPSMHVRMDAGDVPASLHLRIGRLEAGIGHLERAFLALLAGAVRARETYERDEFLACIDEARALYRTTASKRSLQRAMGLALESYLGDEGRGYSGLERLRRLPIAVRVHLTDFGIARKLVEGETTSQDDDGQPWGTPRYMSPEQAKGEPLDHRSDIYSLGCTFYHLLTGAPPFGGDSAMNIIVSHITQEPEPIAQRLPTIDRRMAELIHKMMRKSPLDRFQDYAQLQEAITNVRSPGSSTSSTQLDGSAGRIVLLVDNPSTAEPSNSMGLKQLSVADVNLELGRHEKALGLYEKVLAENPALEVELGFRILKIHQQRGDEEQAREWTRRILRLTGDPKERFYCRWKLLSEHLGRFDDALEGMAETLQDLLEDETPPELNVERLRQRHRELTELGKKLSRERETGLLLIRKSGDLQIELD